VKTRSRLHGSNAARAGHHRRCGKIVKGHKVPEIEQILSVGAAVENMISRRIRSTWE